MCYFILYYNNFLFVHRRFVNKFNIKRFNFRSLHNSLDFIFISNNKNIFIIIFDNINSSHLSLEKQNIINISHFQNESSNHCYYFNDIHQHSHILLNSY